MHQPYQTFVNPQGGMTLGDAQEMIQRQVFGPRVPSSSVYRVSNSDGTLTITPTTGNVAASLNLGHANTWTATQTFQTSTSAGTSLVVKEPSTGNSVTVAEFHVRDQSPTYGPWSGFNDTLSSTVPACYFFPFNNGDVSFGAATTNKALGFFVQNAFNVPSILARGNSGLNGFGGTRISDGTAITQTVLVPAEMYSSNSPTNAVLVVGGVTHDAGSASNGIGTGFCFFCRDSTGIGTDRVCAEIDGIWSTATHATRQGRLVLGAHDSTTTAGAPREGIRIDATGSVVQIGFFGTTSVPQQSGDVAAGLVNLGLFSSATYAGGKTRLTADVTESAGTLTSLSDLTLTLAAGKKYTGRMAVKCVNSVAAEGVQFDFAGGSATMTSFWAGAGILASGGTDVIGTNISTALSGVINFSTFTGESVVIFEISLVCNAGGTFIPRAAENTHAAGTATFRLGTYLWLELSSN